MNNAKINNSNLEKQLGFSFYNPSILRTAFTHRSWLNEHHQIKAVSNERLEFLGDAVLELWSSDRLFNLFPNYPEGQLTNIRSALVRGQSLAAAAKKLKLGTYLRLSRGEEKTGGRENTSLLENTFEALLGAIYSDHGIVFAFRFLDHHLLPKLKELGRQGNIKDAKTLFQEIAQEKMKITPTYQVLNSQGPEHQKLFISGVFLNERLIAKGQGHSKRQAEETAAKKALTIFRKQSKIKIKKNAKN